MSVKEAKAETFEEEIKSGQLVMVDFHADWCGPCKMLGPIVEEIASEVSDITVMKVDVDAMGELASKYGISSIPTVIFFKDGSEVDRFVGVKTKDDIAELITKHK